MNSPKSPVSAFVVCCNEEKHIRTCIESVLWCQEIIIVDSGSTDRTLDICREYPTKILQRPWPGFVEQKRFALEQCSAQWILNLDADEVVSPELRQEIQAEIQRQASPETPQINGYLLPRVVNYLGKWWRKGGWYPEYRLRLCRRTETQWGGEDPHEKALVTGPTAQLKGELQHFTYSEIADQVRSSNSLSSAAARTLRSKGQTFSLLRLLGNPISRFFKFYILKRGYREGLPGFIAAIIESFSVFLKYAKLWELQKLNKK